MKPLSIPCLFAAVLSCQPAHAQGVWNELAKWEEAAPLREADQANTRLRERAMRTPCIGAMAPCETQLVGKGWRVISTAFEPLGVDTGIVVNILGSEGNHQVCTTIVEHDGTGTERPCTELKPIKSTAND